jgi:hypothetical protein
MVSPCYEKTRQIQAAKNLSQKSLASVSGFCKIGIVTSLLLQFLVSKRPAFWRVFFFLRHGFFLSGRYRRVAGPESGLHVLKACRKNLHETIGAFDAGQ